jgi:flagellar assembly protein FliH
MEGFNRAGVATPGAAAASIVAFEYPFCGASPAPSQGWDGSVWDGSLRDEPSEPVIAQPEPPESSTALREEFELRLAEETRRSFDAGRERGRQEGRQAEREAHAAQEQQHKRQMAQFAANFVQERDRYFLAVEREVVQLALAVAARILRREAQMDPLLLTGAVRVALGQLSSTTELRLRVPPAELDLWTEAMALLPNLAVKPAVVAGEGMRLGDCHIETELGSVDIGVRAQLSEIERGFFDRAPGAARAASPPAAAPAHPEIPA